MANRPEVLLTCLKADLTGQGLPVDGITPPDASVKEAAASSIVNSLLKKLDRGRTSRTDAVALAKFVSVNQNCGEWKLPDKYDCKTEIILGEFKRLIDDFWFRDGQSLIDHPFSILAHAGFGPGANLGAEGGDFFTKLFSSSLTATNSSLYFWYRRYTRSFPEWSNAENIRIENYGSARFIAGNKLSFVAKNDETSRCICIEPTLNTYFQLGIGRILESRIYERFGISLSTQQLENRRLACLGSQFDDLSTIDLSSASDSISLKMLKEFLPREFYNTLVSYRSPVCEIKGQGSLQLNMVSTMGNGYTFPLQTMLFCAAVVACLKFRNLSWTDSRYGRNWGVNGDDIVVPSIITRDVISLLNILGFNVNHDKTFVEGPFRESCGADFFLGVNIRGVYIRHLDDQMAVYSAINRLIRFSTRTGISLVRSIKFLLSLLRAPVDYVPIWENLDSGIQIPVDSPLRGSSYSKKRQAFAYSCLVLKTPKLRIFDGYIAVPRPNKPRIYNPNGLYIGFLQGCIYNSSIGSRFGPVSIVKKRRFTSMWDAYLPIPWSYDYGLDWIGWKSRVAAILERE